MDLLRRRVFRIKPTMAVCDDESIMGNQNFQETHLIRERITTEVNGAEVVRSKYIKQSLITSAAMPQPKASEESRKRDRAQNKILRGEHPYPNGRPANKYGGLPGL